MSTRSELAPRDLYFLTEYLLSVSLPPASNFKPRLQHNRVHVHRIGAEAMGVNRRKFIRSVAGVASTAALTGAIEGGVAESKAQSLPAPADSGIQHTVVVMMENRSFDHFLGWLPG